MLQLIRSLFFISTLCITSVAVVGEAHAQSFPDLKKLKDKLTKKEEPEKKKPAAVQSSRSDPLNNRSKTTGSAMNSDSNSDRCFTGNRKQKVCIPKKTINTSPHFSVKNITLQNDGFSNCTLGNSIPNESRGGDVSFRLYCRNADDTLYQANIKATSELYYVTDISVDVCGPQAVNGDSVFFKKIEKRYGSGSEMKLLKGHEMISFRAKTERMKIWKEPTGRFRNREVQSKCFTDTGSLWHFEMRGQMGEEYKAHLKSLLMSDQPAGDDF